MATVFPAKVFDPSADASALEKAMKGLGTDEKAITEILAHRSVNQRKEIMQVYKTSFGKDLLHQLKGELGGNFRKAVLSSFDDKAHVNAKAIYEAMAGAGTNERVLIQVICSSDKREIEELKRAYLDVLLEKEPKSKQRDLEKDICGEVSSDFKCFLVALLQGQRETSVDMDSARADCEDLYKAGEGKRGTDESVFTRIFANRSYEQIKLINEIYSKAMGHGIVKMIEKETSGDYRDALVTVVNCALNKCEAIADMVHASMKGMGTNDDDLIRLIISRSEEDLAIVSEAFKKKHEKLLADWIKNETSGDYKKYLLAILGAERPTFSG